jgi:hypothetical protein
MTTLVKLQIAATNWVSRLNYEITFLIRLLKKKDFWISLEYLDPLEIELPYTNTNYIYHMNNFLFFPKMKSKSNILGLRKNQYYFHI